MTPIQITTLKKTIGPEKTSTRQSDLVKHKSKMFVTHSSKPYDIICYPESQVDIEFILKFSAAHYIPVVPYGSGTSTEGQTAGSQGGICIDLEKMQSIIAFSPMDQTVTVQPGLTYNKLNEEMHQYGLYFPVEAGWGASIGGMVATNASGAGAYWSGSMRDNTIGGKLVCFKQDEGEDSTGVTTIPFGRHTTKSSAGIDLTGLLVGSEGTRGIFSELTLKLKSIKPTKTVWLQFHTFKEAAEYAAKLRSKLTCNKMEFIDPVQYNACITHSKYQFNFVEPNKYNILLEYQVISGSEDKLLLLENVDTTIVEDKEVEKQIWKMRKQAGFAALATSGIPNAKVLVTDTCVPLSSYADYLTFCYAELEKTIPKLYAPVISHIGDGNIHYSIVFNQQDSEHVSAVKCFADVIVRKAIELGGTCSGEHGIGIGKKQYVVLEKCADYLYFSRLIKKSFDPLRLLNPNVQLDLVSAHDSKVTIKSAL